MFKLLANYWTRLSCWEIYFGLDVIITLFLQACNLLLIFGMYPLWFLCIASRYLHTSKTSCLPLSRMSSHSTCKLKPFMVWFFLSLRSSTQLNIALSMIQNLVRDVSVSQGHGMKQTYTSKSRQNYIVSWDGSHISHVSCEMGAFFGLFWLKMMDLARVSRDGCISSRVLQRKPPPVLQPSKLLKIPFFWLFLGRFSFFKQNLGLHLSLFRLKNLIWARSNDRSWNPKSHKKLW